MCCSSCRSISCSASAGGPSLRVVPPGGPCDVFFPVRDRLGSLGKLSSAGGLLLGACYPRKAAAVALEPPEHLSTYGVAAVTSASVS